MSGVSIVGIAANGLTLATGLGMLLSLDPAEAAARNERIRRLTADRRDRRSALENAARCAADARERLAQTFVTVKVDAAVAAAALIAAGLPPDPRLIPPSPGADVDLWCRHAPVAVQAAHERAREATARSAVDRLRAVLPAGALPVLSADDLPTPTGPRDGPGNAAELTVVLTRMLGSLDTSANAVDRAVIEAAAAAIARRKDRAAHLTQLRLQIQEVNDRVAGRHADVLTAAQLLDAMEPWSPTHGLDPELLGGARLALAEVVAGRGPLSDALLDQVAGMREQIEARAALMFATDALADVLEELGYQVGPDFSVGEATAGRLEVSHPGRPDHLVRVKVDAARRTLTAQVLRSSGSADEEADTAATAAWCGALDAAIAQLSEVGLVLTPQLRTAPGSRPTPTVTTAPRQEDRAGHNYRTRERTER